ncbi:ABC transporter permease [Oceanibacterium hippocampi]|uniref:Dipeptide transport system permease protein DppC n=1 Tax=Oceanibacterium hippocampi TaxID=745714 RepID=A0A1Y5SE13_9PROT|nr:ABC transporter permease [Oceanibacterium hippocampi]SLN38564.1 Dipeptide transport system permease protein DppC [Oceanibacterium hippocampi]
MSDTTSRISDNIDRFFDSDVWWSFKSSKVTIGAAIVTVLIIITAIFAHWVAPQNPFDPAQLDLLDSSLPPVWYADGTWKYMLGTDDQGRDILSALLYGSRISLMVGGASVVAAALIGVTLGLLAGYLGGSVDSLIMRVADVQMSFPAILVALLIDGVARGLLPNERHDELAIWVLIIAISLSTWVPFARTVRGSTMVEKNREYVQAARVIGRRPVAIMLHHVLPNVMGPVLVIATIGLATAILTEAALSFLGVGVPPTSPSLGTLIQIGNNFLFSGEWWMVVFPGIQLAVLVLAVNLLGDWLRDALNPKLR